MEFLYVFHVILPQKFFSMEFPWNDFHGMFSVVITRSIELGLLPCRCMQSVLGSKNILSEAT